MNLAGKGRKDIGALGERVAAEYLKRHGFRVLAKNVVRKIGEIDLIARKGDTLHFVEVKSLVVLELPFKAAYMFRPGAIQPLHGARSKTPWVQAVYIATWPLWSVLRRISPRLVTSTEQMGRAMIRVAREGYPRRVLEMEDINGL